jgi:hypothetical protein
MWEDSMKLPSLFVVVACVGFSSTAFADPPVSIMKPGKMMNLASGNCAEGVLFVLAPGAALDDKTREPLYGAARNSGKCAADAKVTEMSRADFIKTPQALAVVERLAMLLTRGNPTLIPMVSDSYEYLFDAKPDDPPPASNASYPAAILTARDKVRTNFAALPKTP